MNMRFCTFCNTQLKIFEMTCPYCKRTQSRTPYILKHITVVAVVLLVIVWLIVFPSINKPSQDVPDSIKKVFNQVNAEVSSSNKPAGQLAKPNSASKKNNAKRLKVFIKNAERVSRNSIQASISKDFQITSGNSISDDYIKVTLNLKNISSNELVYSQSDFRLKSIKGHIVQPDATFSSLKNSISSGILDVNGEYEGILFFKDVQPGENYTLQYRVESGILTNSRYENMSFSIKKQPAVSSTSNPVSVPLKPTKKS